MIVNAEALYLPLADASVDACLTSPPYWGGLRVYDGAQARNWPAIAYSPMPGLPPVEIPAQNRGARSRAGPLRVRRPPAPDLPGGAESAEARRVPRRQSTRSEDLGWSPSCACGSDPVPARVFDPFAGLGRTWEAAQQTGRRFVGTDLGIGYCRLALSRNDVEAIERRKVAERAKTITGPLFEGASP